ncbi:MAG: molybdopterin converting factor subunit 1 [Chloroflexi bacterium]|nr:molybdopterin converting factor subunit 1 [Chloroflexota bacterium]
MKVHVRLFAALREAAGTDRLTLDVPEGTTVRQLVERVHEQLPQTRGIAGAIYAAVNHSYVNPDSPLQEGDEVALFPPVSGGEEVKRFEVTEAPLSLDDVAARVNHPTCGAIVVFSGIVRGITGEMETDHLEYEAYKTMAENTLAQIGQEIRERWPKVEDVAIVHRVGKMAVGEPSVVVAVSSPHRDDGLFEACRYAIDRVKEIVPIWKKEVLTTGAHWVEGPRAQGEDRPQPIPIVENRE